MSLTILQLNLPMKIRDANLYSKNNKRVFPYSQSLEQTVDKTERKCVTWEKTSRAKKSHKTVNTVS